VESLLEYLEIIRGIHEGVAALAEKAMISHISKSIEVSKKAYL
jgi:hypothetical protein